ncbi:unnamed protein product [Rotaria socialis]|uniref:BRCT domain-containing protein n=1 Tax=Rotaria socialis TaxID=392032 RepID=A0A817MPK0_9BILA|nr:unnamed protein product [Rotaria socialis]CAF3205113.1 unnamed protein product [Rotaria socialis]CAF3332552.1 unnamed protein product [Rotaria socialis]CAF3364153.1 unnamed protein product [Rotaria socialis]CAF3432343.1 unnamed protein product [Rotaria socialis]
MSLINFKNILSCSSEDRVHCAKNLLEPEQYKKWLSSDSTDERIVCVLEFETPSLINSVDIGNDGSAFIELLVSQSTSDEWTALLPQTMLMTPNESRSNKNRNQIKVFKSNDLNKTCLNEKWDRLKIICEQKFNSSNQFGLTFIKVNSMADGAQKTELVNKSLNSVVDEDENEIVNEPNKIGSFFTENKFKSISTDNEKAISTNIAEELSAKKSANDNQSQILKKNDVQTDKCPIMKNVVFVLSGFQNPLRSQLRNKAVSMGATYSDDWNEKCTHLISAFPNTPKFNEVLQTGKGMIVSKHWIMDCCKQNQLLSEKSYNLKEKTDKETSKRKLEATNRKNVDEEEAVDTNDTTERTSVKKPSRATNKTANKKNQFEQIPDIFHGKHFYVSYGDYDDNTLLGITRVILAYDGILDRQITSDVKYVITNRMWNQDFAKISKSNPDINFISLDWLQDCHDADQFVPIQPYLVVP